MSHHQERTDGPMPDGRATATGRATAVWPDNASRPQGQASWPGTNGSNPNGSDTTAQLDMIENGPRMAAPDRDLRPGHGTVTVAAYNDYESAQAAVDRLSDNGFPVARAAIVGTGLRLVEQVAGRLTVGRAAIAGAGGGAWIGLLIGLLFGIFTVGAWWRVVLFAVVLGAIWGAVFGALGHAVTQGRRDFTSSNRLVADQYSVVVDADLAEQARRLVR